MAPEVPLEMEGEIRWKKATARDILQGFKHRDVLSGEIAKESPTLTRLGRMVIFMISAVKRWPLWLSNVKSAFLQSEDIRSEGVRLYGKPPIDMEKCLVKLQVMKTGQVLLMTKPAFGDVRAPKLWNNRITTSMQKAECNTPWIPVFSCRFGSFKKVMMNMRLSRRTASTTRLMDLLDYTWMTLLDVEKASNGRMT